VSFQEDALRNTSVLNAGLDDVESIIFKVVVEDALSDSEVFVGVLNNWFLEINIELKYLSVILKPLGGNSGNTIVNLRFTTRDSSEAVGVSFSHGSQELGVDVLLEVHSFLTDGVVLNAEKLGFMVPSDRWVSVRVSG